MCPFRTPSRSSEGNGSSNVGYGCWSFFLFFSLDTATVAFRDEKDEKLPQSYPTLLLPLPSELRDGVRNGHIIGLITTIRRSATSAVTLTPVSEATQEGRSCEEKEQHLHWNGRRSCHLWLHVHSWTGRRLKLWRRNFCTSHYILKCCFCVFPF